MALGRCAYMSCDSMLGSSFRASFVLGATSQGRRGDREVLLCSSHEPECRELRDKMPGALMMSPEGWVYSRVWVEALP